MLPTSATIPPAQLCPTGDDSAAISQDEPRAVAVDAVSTRGQSHHASTVPPSPAIPEGTTAATALPARFTGAAATGSGAAYDPRAYRRKRVTAVVFTQWSLLVHECGEGVQLLAAHKAHKKEPLRAVAIRARSVSDDDLKSRSSVIHQQEGLRALFFMGLG